MARQLVEMDGVWAMAVPDPSMIGSYMVVTARMRNVVGEGSPSTKNPHTGPTRRLTLQDAEAQAKRWDKYLEGVAQEDGTTGKGKRKAQKSTPARTR